MIHPENKTQIQDTLLRPDLVLLVDYPGMNVGLARLAVCLHSQVHYVAPPQLWAYRNPQRRIKRLRTELRGVSLQTLFPFEMESYAPWASRLRSGHFYHLPVSHAHSGKRLLLCPGSRAGVVRRNLTLWLNRLKELGLTEEIDVLVPEHLKKLAERILAGQPTGRKQSYVVLTEPSVAFSRAKAAIAFPGTMTLELFLQRIPTVVWAILDPLTLMLGRRKLRHEFVALPNLLLGKQVFPEWIGTAEDFKRNPPSLSAWPVVSEQDLVAIQVKMGPSNGVDVGIQACVELLT